MRIHQIAEKNLGTRIQTTKQAQETFFKIGNFKKPQNVRRVQKPKKPEAQEKYGGKDLKPNKFAEKNNENNSYM